MVAGDLESWIVEYRHAYMSVQALQIESGPAIWKTRKAI